jgi:lysozyme family protein
MTGLREVFDRFKPQPKSDGGISKAVGQVINKPDAPRPDNREHDPISGKTTTVARPVEPAPKKSGPISTGHDPDEGTEPWYRRMFAACEIDKGYEDAVAHDVRTVLRGESRYRVVEARTGVPWWIIGCLHFKEASCDFDGILHNGEHGIIGTDAMRRNRKSTIVPKGVGPFPTWEASAVDAIKENSRWKKIAAGGRDIGEILYAAERFNGQGYLSQTSEAGKENSPYLWARSNINDGFGKYVRDHVFDPNAPTNKTTGLAVILKELAKAGKIEISV